MKRRYEFVESDEAIALSTLLDPRFKDKFFTDSFARSEAQKMLNEKMDELRESGQSAAPTDSTEEPPAKKPPSDLWKSFSEIVEEAGG